MSELYHVELGFPSDVVLMSGIIYLTYSKHAIRASYDDRYGMMNLPSLLDIKFAKIIEIEVENGRVVKSVYRSKYDKVLDIIIVVNYDGFVRTVWFNKVSDRHQTLDVGKYTKI